MTKFKLMSSDGNQFLTIVSAQGKTGFNVKASVKDGKGKGAPKAKTGARSSFKTEKEADAAATKLQAEGLKLGWVKVETRERNAFTAIPAPAKKTVAPTSKSA